jgi:hypothetical protein
VLVHRGHLERFATITTMRMWSKRKPRGLRKFELDIGPVGTDVEVHFHVP